MQLAQITAVSIFKLFLILLVGYTASKAGMIDSDVSKGLSKILMYVTNPMIVVSSFFCESTAEKTRGFFMVFIAGSVIMLLILFLSKYLFPDTRDRIIEQISSSFGNVGYMGIPLISALVGTEGIFYMTALMLCFNLYFWSLVPIMADGKADGRAVKKALINPNMIAIYCGLIIYLCQVPVPAVLQDPISMLGNCNTPMSMLVAGTTIATNSMAPAFRRKGMYIIWLFKMLIAPLAAVPFVMILNFPPDAKLALMIGLACPTGALCPMYALLTDRDAGYAYAVFSVTTLSCIITIPLISLVYNLVI